MSIKPHSNKLQATGPGGAVPVHICIIMDGNGRWAVKHGLPRAEGHRRGAGAVRVAIEEALRHGVKYLTLFGFSSENWKRPSGEVMDLMGLLRLYLRKELAELDKKGVRFRAIGERSRLPQDIQELIQTAEERTCDNTGLTLVIALSYGGRAEIVNAARVVAQEVKAGTLDPETLDESTFAAHLETTDIPDPDLLIRTSGERRISNFLLWQCAYTEFVFSDVLWPDFSVQDFDDAIGEYQLRDRRYGAIGV